MLAVWGLTPIGSKKPAQAGVKDGCPPKNGYFIAIGSFSVKQLQIDGYILLIITSTMVTGF